MLLPKYTPYLPGQLALPAELNNKIPTDNLKWIGFMKTVW